MQHIIKGTKTIALIFRSRITYQSILPQLNFNQKIALRRIKMHFPILHNVSGFGISLKIQKSTKMKFQART